MRSCRHRMRRRCARRIRRRASSRCYLALPIKSGTFHRQESQGGLPGSKSRWVIRARCRSSDPPARLRGHRLLAHQPVLGQSLEPAKASTATANTGQFSRRLGARNGADAGVGAFARVRREHRASPAIEHKLARRTVLAPSGCHGLRLRRNQKPPFCCAMQNGIGIENMVLKRRVNAHTYGRLCFSPSAIHSRNAGHAAGSANAEPRVVRHHQCKPHADTDHRSSLQSPRLNSHSRSRVANTGPVMTVHSAAWRNHIKAAGAVTCGDGRLFVRPESLASTESAPKLKYQSGPIHKTPNTTCSQRTKNAPTRRVDPKCVTLAGDNAVVNATMMTSSTTPAISVRCKRED